MECNLQKLYYIVYNIKMIEFLQEDSIYGYLREHNGESLEIAVFSLRSDFGLSVFFCVRGT